MKTCGKCNTEKELTEFYKNKALKDNLTLYCKSCHKEYYAANKEKILKTGGEYRRKNKDAILISKRKYNRLTKSKRAEYRKEYYNKNKNELAEKQREYFRRNKARAAEYGREYRRKNKGRLDKRRASYERWRRRSDPAYALTGRLRRSMNGALATLGRSKSKATLEALGCTSRQFCQHIERQFLKGMTWENRDKWHLDHIIPISSAETEDEIYALSHFTNIRPMWAKSNQSKGSKIEYLI